MANAEAYPLRWPSNFPRTPKPKYSAFGLSLTAARDHLLKELRLLGARDIVISSNARLRRDGLPAAQQGYTQDTGVAVYFTLKGKAQCIPCDRWNLIEDNIRAIGKSVEALRGLERWGAQAMIDAVFSGLAALPESTSGEAWWTVLGVLPGADRETIERAYRNRARETHPDVGGDPARFQAVQAAYQQATAVTKAA